MNELDKQQTESILNLLKQKSVMKQDVYSNTIASFTTLKHLLKKKADSLSDEVSKIDKRVNISYKDTSLQSAQLKVAGDMLDFEMHSNVFEMDKSNPMFKGAYLKANPFNSYCGIISVYNFLADSYKYNRYNDLGYLIARIFVNRERKFYVESRFQITNRYSSFSDFVLDEEHLSDIVNELIIYSVTFDLITPPYDAVRQVTVGEVQEKSSSAALRTGKRLGYGSSNSESEVNGFENEANL